MRYALNLLKPYAVQVQHPPTGVLLGVEQPGQLFGIHSAAPGHDGWRANATARSFICKLTMGAQVPDYGES